VLDFQGNKHFCVILSTVLHSRTRELSLPRLKALNEPVMEDFAARIRILFKKLYIIMGCMLIPYAGG